MVYDDAQHIHTHDAARDLLRYAAPGVSVEIEPVWPPAANARRYRLTLDAAPGVDVSMMDVYSLPQHAPTLLRRVRSLAASAYEALSRKDGLHRV